jgi:hypothetical protein
MNRQVLLEFHVVYQYQYQYHLLLSLKVRLYSPYHIVSSIVGACAKVFFDVH